jgi:capsule polysaccharide export protein KpsE/RkpR
MVDVAFESAAGIVHVRANAFTPEDAQAISAAILAESSEMVNRLSEQAREDAVRFAREELAEAEGALRDMRQRLSDFRLANRIVDPSADVAGQMGLLNALQGELAQALVERDMLLSFVGEDDQRVIQAGRRVDAITGRIEAERASLGVAGSGRRPRRRARCPTWWAATRSCWSTSSSPTPPTPKPSPGSPRRAPRRGASRATSPRTCSRPWPKPRSIRAAPCCRG